MGTSNYGNTTDKKVFWITVSIQVKGSIMIIADHCTLSLHEVDDILSLDLKEYGTDFKAIYMDPPLLLPGEEPTPGKIHVDDLVSDSYLTSKQVSSTHTRNEATVKHTRGDSLRLPLYLA